MSLTRFVSTFLPLKKKSVGLMHLTLIDRKPEPLVTEFKNLECGRTDIFSVVEFAKRE